MTNASLRASIPPSWLHVGDPSFWSTITLGGPWTGASRLTIAHVALASPRETPCSTSPARSSSFLHCTFDNCGLRLVAVHSHRACGLRAIVEEDVASVQKVPTYQPEVEVFVLCIMELCNRYPVFSWQSLPRCLVWSYLLLCTTRLIEGNIGCSVLGASCPF